MTDDYAFIYTGRDMREIVQAEREKIAQAIEALAEKVAEHWQKDDDDYFGALHEAARIARSGGTATTSEASNGGRDEA